MFDFQWFEWLVLIITGLGIGFAKTGIQGSTIPVVVLMAITFGGQVSAGMMLLFLLVGDSFAIKHYGKEVSIKGIWHLLPSTVVGVILGVIYGNVINDNQFKMTIAVIVLICLALLIHKEVKNSTIKIPNHSFVSALVGILSGFSSMVGNAAGPIFSVYILSKSIDKRKMISTTAWFFLVTNLVKLPFHIFVWETIDVSNAILALILLPIIFIGTRVGIFVIHHIKETTYRKLIFITTIISAFYLFLS